MGVVFHNRTTLNGYGYKPVYIPHCCITTVTVLVAAYCTRIEIWNTPRQKSNTWTLTRMTMRERRCLRALHTVTGPSQGNRSIYTTSTRVVWPEDI